GGHNSVQVAARDQSRSGGPFMWVRPARTRVLDVRFGDDGEVIGWCAEHDGYSSLDAPAVHRRRVCLDRERTITVVDQIERAGQPPFALTFHLAPPITAALSP